ncbi:MAG TPA: XdhC/CoxI family protein [Candidatus Dormibacteraeota bacterium]|nr:XdhC/CoxI family protein [Candidatus Dormibacteraeota bacterium]
MPSVEEELARRLGHGEELVLATVIKLDGEPPSQRGAKLLMSRQSALAGTLGCSEFDSAALADADAIATAGSPQLRTYRHDLGSIEVYLEPYTAAPGLVVFANTPVGRALAKWAPEVGFRVQLVESAADLPSELPGELYIVHTNHDAPDLVDALEAVLPRNPRFIGLVGSRRHTGHHLEALRAKGVPEDVIARIQSPVGLDIGARTAEEIALSILAGLVAVRRGAAGGWKSST